MDPQESQHLRVQEIETHRSAPPTPPPAPEESAVRQIEMSAGQLFARRYLIEEMVDGGGMGCIYLARQQPLGRRVVLKTLSEMQRRDPASTARFDREARALSRLQHPNIVSFIDHGREDGNHYIVMEYVEGETLRAMLDRERTLTLEDFLNISVQLLDGVGAAHQRGIIHRDLKPANMMLCQRRGQPVLVKLLDFGLARSLSPDDEVTRQGLMGSVLYLAPERIRGGDLTTRADIYALGVLFYHMLSGCYPIAGGNDFDILMAHVRNEPMHLAEVLPKNHNLPDTLIHLIMRCLDKDPENRHADANSLLDEMLELAKEHKLPVETSTPAPRKRHTRSIRETANNIGITAPDTARAFSEMPTALQAQAEVHSADHAIIHPAFAQGFNPPASNPMPPPQPLPPQVVVTNESRKGLQIALMALVFVFALGILGLAAYHSGLVGSGAQDSAQTHAEGTLAVLDRADTLIKAGRYGEAEFLVRSIDPGVQRNPTILVRLASVRESLEIGRTLNAARTYEENGDQLMAREAYERILRRDPSNQEARARLRILRQTP